MPQTIHLNGDAYVIVPKEEYDALNTMANLPPYPDPLPNGNYPALEYARASLARDIILTRTRLGLSQAELARRAGIRVETLNRIESGKVTPSLGSIQKIDRALKDAERGKPSRPRKKQGET